MNAIKLFITKYWLTAIGGLIGGTFGYVYWLNWACNTGCPLTATPTRTVLYGMVLGGLIFSLFSSKQDKIEDL